MSCFGCGKLPAKDFGLGVGVSELVVVRSGMDESTGGYQYTIIFLEETDVVPQMLVGFRTLWDLVRESHCPTLGRKLGGGCRCIIPHVPFRARLHFRLAAPPACQTLYAPSRLFCRTPRVLIFRPNFGHHLSPTKFLGVDLENHLDWVDI